MGPGLVTGASDDDPSGSPPTPGPAANMAFRWAALLTLPLGDYVNGKAAKILGWLTIAIMAVAAVAMFATGGISF